MWYQLLEGVILIARCVHFDIWDKIKVKILFSSTKIRMGGIRNFFGGKFFWKIFENFFFHISLQISKCTPWVIKTMHSKSWYHIWLSHNNGLFLVYQNSYGGYTKFFWKIFEKTFFSYFTPNIKMYALGNKKYAFKKLISHLVVTQ